MAFDFILSLFSPFRSDIALFIFAIVVLIVINLCYKYLVNQGDAKRIKETVKRISAEMKEYQKQGNAEKAKEHLHLLNTENMKLMRMSFKPMIVSMIIIIIFLPGIGTVYDNKFVSLETSNVTVQDVVYALSIENGTLRTDYGSCALPCRFDINSTVWNGRISSVNSSIVELERVVAALPLRLPVVGDDFGWLGWYIFVSIPLAVLIRKLLGIYS